MSDHETPKTTRVQLNPVNYEFKNRPKEDIIPGLGRASDEQVQEVINYQATVPAYPNPSATGGDTLYPVISIYNEAGELLYVTKTPQLQQLKRFRWYLEMATATFSWHESRAEQEQAKIEAIIKGRPKWGPMF